MGHVCNSSASDLGWRQHDESQTHSSLEGKNLDWTLVEIALALGLSILFYAWISYPLKRFIGQVGFPPNHSIVLATREGKLSDELRELFLYWDEQRVIQIVALFLNYVLIGYVIAFAATGLAYLFYRDIVGDISQMDLQGIIMSAFVFGTLCVSCARISAVHHSASLLRALFSAVCIILTLVVCVIVLDVQLMTELTDFALKPYYADFTVHSIPVVCIALIGTEIVIDVTRGLFSVSRFVPVALFGDLGQLYYERATAFGEREVERLALELLDKCEIKYGEITSVHIVLLNYEQGFIERLEQLLSKPARQVPIIKVITISDVALQISETLGSDVDVAVVNEHESLHWERFFVLNKSVGMVYRRIPASQYDNANVAQIFDGFMEVQLAIGAFDSLFARLKSQDSDLD